MKRYCVIRQEKIKSLSALGRAYNHNYRTSASAAPEADASLRYRNEELCDGLIREGMSYNDIYAKRVEESDFYRNHPVRKNSVPAVEMVLSFSQDMVGQFDIEKWKEANYKWLKKKYGDNLISAMYHDDEYALDGKNASPHIHAVVLPFDNTQQLNASKMCGNKFDFIQLQDEYAKEMAQFGLERGNRNVMDKHVSPKEYHAQLKAIEAKMHSSIVPMKDDESFDMYKERLEDSLTRATVECFKESKDEIQEKNVVIAKKNEEIRSLKAILSNQKSLDELIVERSAARKKSKLEAEIDKIVNEDGSDVHKTFDKLMSYLGIDHEDLTVNDIKRARDIAAKGSILEKAISGYPDQDLAREMATNLSIMFKYQRDREKEMKQKEKAQAL